jgi:hypothetical protein
VEDAKSGGGLSGLASLAGQFGVDVGGGGGGSLIAEDNILLYFKSESLAKEVLLSKYEGEQSFADRYIQVYDLSEKWKSIKHIGEIKFPVMKVGEAYSRLQDSLISIMIKELILKSQFAINKIDKKSGFIQMSVSMRDESLAKAYCDKLLEIAVNRYVALKTERQKKTVENLQYRADSISSLLNKKTSATAALQTATATMDLNPLYRTNTAVTTELTTRDKTMLSTVYGEVIKNLELAKFTLSQETPVIQIVDQDNFPLKRNKTSKLQFLLLGGSLASFMLIIILFAKKLIESNLS